MENKIITLNNNEEYIVLKDLVIDEKKYIFCTKYNEENETIDEDSFVIAEVVLEDNNIKLFDINDENTATKVTNAFLEEMKKINTNI